jgi:hypothetical protein
MLSQKQRWMRDGYLSGIPIFSQAEMLSHLSSFDRLRALLEPNESPYVIDGWEKHNRWLYSLAMDPRILDAVEAVLGPDFYQWGSNMMCKDPDEALYVPWHQDIRDWPLSPARAVTVWIAFDLSDEENGCMRAIPGSHLRGLLPHIDRRPPPRDGCSSLFRFHLDPRFADEENAVSLPLQPGEISIHDCRLIHGSEGNRSGKRRCGFSICYAATEVACDLEFANDNGSWADFSIFMCRGVDRHRHNPYAEPPKDFGRTAAREYRIPSAAEDRAREQRPAIPAPRR